MRGEGGGEGVSMRRVEREGLARGGGGVDRENKEWGEERDKKILDLSL